MKLVGSELLTLTLRASSDGVGVEAEVDDIKSDLSSSTELESELGLNLLLDDPSLKKALTFPPLSETPSGSVEGEACVSFREDKEIVPCFLEVNASLFAA